MSLCLHGVNLGRKTKCQEQGECHSTVEWRVLRSHNGESLTGYKYTNTVKEELRRIQFT